MKVIISYACDLKKIPDNVRLLLNDLKIEFAEMQDLLQHSVNQTGELKILEAMKSIGSLRQRLVDAEIRSADCSSILAGYLKTTADFDLESPEVSSTKEASPHVVTGTWSEDALAKANEIIKQTEREEQDHFAEEAKAAEEAKGKLGNEPKQSSDD